MYIDICEINSNYRGADRDINPELFSLSGDSKLDFKLYCDFCNYELEFKGEEKVLNNRLDMLNKLRKKNKNIELIIFDINKITCINNLDFLGFDVLNDFFESPLSYSESTFFKNNIEYLNNNFLFKSISDAQTAILNTPLDEAGHMLYIYYIYRYLI